MKYKLFIMILLVSNCLHAPAQNISLKSSTRKKLPAKHLQEHSLGQNIFKALKEKDSDQWILLYPTSNEYKNVLQEMLAAKIEGLSQQMIDDMIARRINESSTAYRKEFMTFISQADSMSINWKHAVFQNFDYIAVYPEKVKLKYLTGDIWFRCGKEHFVVEGIEALKTPAGYKLQSVKGIRQVDDGD